MDRDVPPQPATFTGYGWDKKKKEQAWRRGREEVNVSGEWTDLLNRQLRKHLAANTTNGHQID